MPTRIIFILLLTALSAAAQLPEAPQPQTQPPAKFWTFRGVYRDANGNKRFDPNAPALRTSKKMWIVFAAEHGAMFGAWLAANHQKESAGSEIPAMLGVTGLDFAAMKLLSPAMAVEAPVYGVWHYLRAR